MLGAQRVRAAILISLRQGGQSYRNHCFKQTRSKGCRTREPLFLAVVRGDGGAPAGIWVVSCKPGRGYIDGCCKYCVRNEAFALLIRYKKLEREYVLSTTDTAMCMDLSRFFETSVSENCRRRLEKQPLNLLTLNSQSVCAKPFAKMTRLATTVS